MNCAETEDNIVNRSRFTWTEDVSPEQNHQDSVLIIYQDMDKYFFSGQCSRILRLRQFKSEIIHGKCTSVFVEYFYVKTKNTNFRKNKISLCQQLLNVIILIPSLALLS